MNSCCEPLNWGPEEVPNGECEDCGAETVNGTAYEICGYSPVLCETCGSAPCDLSC